MKVIRAMIDSAREMCDSVRGDIGMQKKDVWRLTKKKKEKLKDVYTRGKKRSLKSLEGRCISS